MIDRDAQNLGIGALEPGLVEAGRQRLRPSNAAESRRQEHHHDVLLTAELAEQTGFARVGDQTEVRRLIADRERQRAAGERGAALLDISQLASSLLARRRRRGLLQQTPLDDAPVHIVQEGLNILGALGRLVVQQERMLPNVEDEDGLVARWNAVLVQGDPVVA